MTLFTENYHSHTERCKHASGTVLDYAIAARIAGLRILGISDHTPLPDNRWPEVRMCMSELPDYVAEVEAAQEAVPEVEIILGLECEYDPVYEDFFRETLMKKYGVKYLVGGAHWYPYEGQWIWSGRGPMNADQLRAYSAYLVASIKSGLFAFQAHPDHFAAACLEWTADAAACARAILQAAAEERVPLEINAYGLRKAWVDTPEGRRPQYPWRKFWELAAEYPIQVIVNSDCHRPEDMIAEMDTALGIANDYGLALATLKIGKGRSAAP